MLPPTLFEEQILSQVTHSHTKYDEKDKPFTTYEIHLEQKGRQWSVLKRYSEFWDFNKQLNEVYARCGLPVFPTKRAVGNMEKEFVNKRRAALETYLQGVLSMQLAGQCDLVYRFLGVEREGISPPLASPERTGWMTKQAYRVKLRWDKRFFILKNHEMYYFKSDDNVLGSSPQGRILLTDVSIISAERQTGRKFSFGIHHPQRRTYLCQAPTEAEMLEWMQSIRQDGSSATLEDFELLKVVGRGSFGKVLQVRKKDTGQIFAMKVLKKSNIIKRNQVQHTKTERSILTRIQHPFLVSLKFAFQSEDKLYMILDYVNGGELFSHLKKEKRFSEDRARLYAAEVLLALEYLHELDVVYRDLKPENILMDAEGHVRLTDFGLSKEDVSNDDATYTFCGTPEYMAPEILMDEGHGRGVDWWSLGVLVYEMLIGMPPFFSRNRKEMYFKILKTEIKFPPYVSDTAQDLLRGLLTRAPAERLGCGAEGSAEIKAHPFFASIDWDAVLAKEIKPSFVPNVSGGEDTSNFDAMFTREVPILSEARPGERSHNFEDFSGFTFEAPSELEKLAMEDRSGESSALAARQPSIPE